MDIFSHAWLGGLFADEEVAALWAPEAHLQHMLDFEEAWSRFGHLAGLWSEEKGTAAADAIAKVKISPADLREGTARDGVCVPSFVKMLRSQTGLAEIHRGATSQDVIDSATIMSLQKTMQLFGQRLELMLQQLRALDMAFGQNRIMARTRMQAALEISVSERIKIWQVHLSESSARIDQYLEQNCQIQVGGAVGDRRHLGDENQFFVDTLAIDLGLTSSATSWHTQRQNMLSAGEILSAMTVGLGKFGQDICLMAQQGIDEVSIQGAGGSSAMPHKQNPVSAELLVTLARFNATQIGGLHQAGLHEQERSGSAWSLEWMILPQMAMASGCALLTAERLLNQIVGLGKPVATTD